MFQPQASSTEKNNGTLQFLSIQRVTKNIMLSFTPSFSDNTAQKKNYEQKLLEDLKKELLSGYKNDIESEINTRILEQNLKLRENETMLQAEFYHLCKLKNIKCYLEAPVKNGIIDAVIFTNFQIIIIEFKFLRKNQNIAINKSLKKQINKYLRKNIPIIIITNKCDMYKILSFVSSNHLSEKIYMFNKEILELSTILF